jgi:hypothetical protein
VRLVPDSWGLREFNPNHEPAGSPVGGQFALKSTSTGTPEFQAWFKGSKVVDAEGKPLRAYHGTTKDFDTFNTQQVRVSKNPYWLGDLGSWFTAPSLRKDNYDEENAESVAGFFADKPGGRILPVYLSIRNPKEYEDYEELQDEVYSYVQRLGRQTGHSGFRAMLAASGYDGIVIRNSMTDGDADRDDWVAFEPHQIKSALANRTFNPRSGRFTETLWQD